MGQNGTEDHQTRDYWTRAAMRTRGGSFIIALAELWERADYANQRLIKEAWPDYITEYEKYGKDLELAAKRP